jgi:hypothetical protein
LQVQVRSYLNYAIYNTIEIQRSLSAKNRKQIYKVIVYKEGIRAMGEGVKHMLPIFSHVSLSECDNVSFWLFNSNINSDTEDLEIDNAKF